MTILSLQPHHVQTAFCVQITKGVITGNRGYWRMHPDLQNYLTDNGIEDYRIYVVTGDEYRTPYEVDFSDPLPPIRGVIRSVDIAKPPSLQQADGYYLLAAPPNMQPWLNASTGHGRTVHIEVDSDRDAALLRLYL